MCNNALPRLPYFYNKCCGSQSEVSYSKFSHLRIKNRYHESNRILRKPDKS